MAWTSHDSIFGWIHSFRFNRNNYMFGGRFGTNERPYPVIINQPSFSQVINNWNAADTALVVAFFFAGFFVARRIVNKDLFTDGIIERRNDYKRYHRIFTVFGLVMALRNSANRLEGFVPNGLPRETPELVKYDFTSEILNSTIWKYFIESHHKPSTSG